MRIVVFLVALVFAAPLHAQSAVLEGDVTFDPFSVGEFALSDIYDIDAGFAAQFGIAVPAAVRVLVPRHDDLHVQAVAVPDGGALLGFVFSDATITPQGRTFLENLQITNAMIPLQLDQPNPAESRIRLSARLLEEEVLPQMTQGYERIEIFAIETIDLGNVQNAVQLVAGYYDPQFRADMMLRIVVFPHPTQAESYIAAANIDLAQVPVTDPATLAATVSGRVFSSWQYQ